MMASPLTAAQLADLTDRLDALDLAAFAMRHEIEAAAVAETSAPAHGAADDLLTSATDNLSFAAKASA